MAPNVEGKLKKLGGVGGKMEQTRWFELRGKELVYYADPPKGRIEMRDVDITAKSDKDEAFVIKGANLAHDYVMIAQSRDDRDRWIDMLSTSLRRIDDDDAEARCLHLEQEREALFATSKQLGDEIQDRNRQLASTREQLFSTKDTLKSTKEKLDDLKKKHAALDEEFAEEKKLRAEDAAVIKARLDKQVAAHQAEMEAKNTKLAAMDAADTASAAKIEGLEENVASLTAKEKKLKEEKEKGKKKLADLQAKVEKMAAEHQEELATAKAKYDTAVKEHKEDLARVTQHMENDRARLEKVAAAARAGHDEAVAKLEGIIEKKDGELAQHLKSLERCQKLHDDQVAKIAALEGEMRKLTTKLDFAHEREKCIRVLAEPLDAGGAPGGDEDVGAGTRGDAKVFEVVGPQGAIVRRDVDVKSEYLCILPKGSAVRVEELRERRGRISAPINGWISVATAAGVAIVEEAAMWPFPDSASDVDGTAGTGLQYVEGETVEIPVRRDGSLAGWVSGRITDVVRPAPDAAASTASAGADDSHATISQAATLTHLPPPKAVKVDIHSSTKALALGERGTVSIDACGILRKPAEDALEWVVYDHPDSARRASTVALRHSPGYGCHKGRLTSDFAWMADEEDTAPWYQIDLPAVEEVKGVCIAGYTGRGLNYYPKSFSVWVKPTVDTDDVADPFGTSTRLGSVPNTSLVASPQRGGADDSTQLVNRSMNKSLNNKSMSSSPSNRSMLGRFMGKAAPGAAATPAQSPEEENTEGNADAPSTPTQPQAAVAASEAADTPAASPADVSNDSTTGALETPSSPPPASPPRVQPGSAPPGWVKILVVDDHATAAPTTLAFDRPVIGGAVRIVIDAWEGDAAVARAGVIVNAANYAAELDTDLKKGPPGTLVYDDVAKNVWLRTKETQVALLQIKEKYDAVALLQQSIMEDRMTQEAAFKREKEDWDSAQLRLMDMNSTLTQNIVSLKETGEVEVRRTIVLDTTEYPTFESTGSVLKDTIVSSVQAPKQLAQFAAAAKESLRLSPTKKQVMAIESGMRIAEVSGVPVHDSQDIAVQYARCVANGDADVPLTVFQWKTSEVVAKLREEVQTLMGDVYRKNQSVLQLEEEVKKAKQEVVMTKTSQLGVATARSTAVDEVLL